MKKIISLVVALFLLCGLNVMAFAEESENVSVKVTVADKGKLVMSLEEITVTDKDGDGKLTINDVLVIAHEKNCIDGYTSSETEYGLSMTKLWGDTSGSFGYYLNNASAWSLLDEVKDGDSVYAFVYADGMGWSDSYSFFDVNSVQITQGKTFNLTLSASGYDENWNPITSPVANATIVIDGVATEIKTDSNGKAEITLDKSGTVLISASSDQTILVPPVCIATVNSGSATPDSTPETGDMGNNFVFVAILGFFVSLIVLKKRSYVK